MITETNEPILPHPTLDYVAERPLVAKSCGRPIRREREGLATWARPQDGSFDVAIVHQKRVTQVTLNRNQALALQSQLSAFLRASAQRRLSQMERAADADGEKSDVCL